MPSPKNRSVASAIVRNTTNPNTLVRHYGTVQSVQSSATPPTLSATIDGGVTTVSGIPYVNSYAPAPGDVAYLIRRKSVYTAMGAITDTPGSGASTYATTTYVDSSFAGAETYAASVAATAQSNAETYAAGLLMSGNPAGHMYTTGQTVIANATSSVVGSTAEDYLNGSMYWNGTALTAGEAGLYLVSCSVSWQNGGGGIVGSGIVVCGISVAGNTTNVRQWESYAPNGFSPSVGGTSVLLASVGTAFTLTAGNFTGGTQGTNPGQSPAYTELSAVLVSR